MSAVRVSSEIRAEWRDLWPTFPVSCGVLVASCPGGLEITTSSGCSGSSPRSALIKICANKKRRPCGGALTAQMRRRNWRLQFWMARRGETDVVSVVVSVVLRYISAISFSYRLYLFHIIFSRFHSEAYISATLMRSVCCVHMRSTLIPVFWYRCQASRRTVAPPVEISLDMELDQRFPLYALSV